MPPWCSSCSADSLAIPPCICESATKLLKHALSLVHYEHCTSIPYSFTCNRGDGACKTQMKRRRENARGLPYRPKRTKPWFAVSSTHTTNRTPSSSTHFEKESIMSDKLNPGDSLAVDGSITSQNGQSTLIMRGEGYPARTSVQAGGILAFHLSSTPPDSHTLVVEQVPPTSGAPTPITLPRNTLSGAVGRRPAAATPAAV